MIRIISGNHRGRRIRAPKNLPVRPTTDRSKEALFNILAPRWHWPDIRVLDLYAGTGNISYECASRGSPDITSVDAHPGCSAFIANTARDLEMPIRAVRSDVPAFLLRSGTSYDFIFADPPYDHSPDSLRELVDSVYEFGLLSAGGLLVIEHGKDTNLEGLKGFRRARRYGGSVFSFFEKE